MSSRLSSTNRSLFRIRAIVSHTLEKVQEGTGLELCVILRQRLGNAFIVFDEG